MKKVILFLAFTMLAVISMFAQTVYENSGIKVEITGTTGANTNFRITNKLNCTHHFTLVYNNGSATVSQPINGLDFKQEKIKMNSPTFTFTSQAVCGGPFTTVTINGTLPVKITSIQTKLIVTTPKP
jgi:hypothetical protein